MSEQTATAGRKARTTVRALVVPAALLVLVVAIALDTRLVPVGQAVQADVFSPEAYGDEQFPKIQSDVESRAVDAETLATDLAADKAAATEKYGTPSGVAPVFPVSFTGVVGEGKSGIFDIDVAGLPDGTRVRVQTGPAINGTELRDITGTIEFGQFKNQIEYQNAGAAINDAMKTQVLAGLDRDSLTGKTASVVGAFRMINPKSWLVTPVTLSVQ